MTDQTNTSMPYVSYNDSFDNEHYPVKDWHIEELIRVHRHLGLDDCAEWVYFATIHGVIFKFVDEDCHPAKCYNRLDRSDVEFLDTVKQMRWFTPGEKSFEIALTHHENEVVK